MARGHPDWGATAPVETIAPVLDLGELAARLGSIVTFDRRGNVFYLEDFEKDIKKWLASTSGAGANVAWSSAKARNGQYSCALTAGTDALRNAQISKPIPPSGISTWGLEASFSLSEDTEAFLLQLEHFTGTHRLTFAIRWTAADEILAYRNNTGTYTTIATNITLALDNDYFNTAKLVCNLTTQQYSRLIWNFTEYSLTGLTPESVVATGAQYIVILLALTGTAGSGALAYVDDVVITQNEP